MEFVYNAWWLLGLFIIITLSKVLLPKESFKIQLSLIIALGGLIFFGFRFVSNVADNFNLWPFISCVVCGIYIISGGKTIQAKTISGVQSKFTKRFVGVMNAGTDWADPIFEIVTVSVDGIPNKSADLQKLEIIIPETPLMQTSTRGIQAKVKKISFMLELEEGKMLELLEIEGGVVTVRERVVEYIDEFFLGKISQLSPEKLDQDKKAIIETLAEELKEEVNEFCTDTDNNYPYQITGSVIIADTELEVKYYEALSKKEFAKLEQQAKDVEANKLRLRLYKFGKKSLPNASEKEQVEYALVALKVVPREIKENKFAIDPELAQLAKDIALYFKK